MLILVSRNPSFKSLLNSFMTAQSGRCLKLSFWAPCLLFYLHLNQNYQVNIESEMIQKAIRFSMSFTYPCPRKLREIMKISLIQRQSSARIGQIWKQYHAPRPNNTCTVIDKHKYQFFHQRASSAPFFLLPVFRQGGHFKLITQWQNGCFLGTFLEDFKRKGSNSQPYVVYTFFTQLLAQKDIVMVRGDIINNGLTKAQADKIWSLLQESYSNEGKFQLVHNFNNNTAMFNEKLYNESFGISS